MAGYGGGTTYGGQGGARSPDRVGYGGPQLARVGGRIGGAAAGALGVTSRGVHGGLSMKPWTPPPIPTGFYNPIRDVELATGPVNLSQTLANIGRQRTATEQNYNLGIEGIKEGLAHTLGEDTRAREQDTTGHNEAMANIARAFKNLQGSQEQNANQAGVFSGGALLQAAAKRASNEGIQNQGENTRFQNALANLAANEKTSRETAERGEGKEGLTKQQQLEELGMKGTQAEGSEAFNKAQTEFVKGREAAEAGYNAPTGPAGRRGGGSRRRGGGGFNIPPIGSRIGGAARRRL